MAKRTITVEIEVDEETLEEALQELEGPEAEWLHTLEWPRLRRVTKVTCEGKELVGENTGAYAYGGTEIHYYLPVNCPDETTLTVTYASA